MMCDIVVERGARLRGRSRGDSEDGMSGGGGEDVYSVSSGDEDELISVSSEDDDIEGTEFKIMRNRSPDRPKWVANRGRKEV